MPIFFGAVADDDTGATDLAGMLADRGMRAVLILEERWREDFERWTREADAVVIGTASRSAERGVAYEATRRAVRLLETIDPKCLQIKYCSTFDSTPEGNIGASLDAAMDEIDQEFIVAVPAFPVNGRTTYMGHHFVGEHLLSDSALRNHPLNPMTNPNLVAHLQTQTKRRVGLIPHVDVREGTDRIRESIARARSGGVEIALVDCTSERDTQSICEAISDMQLISGSSALGMYLPSSWVASAPSRPKRGSGGRGFLVVSGSCSPVTRRQNVWLAAHQAVTITLEAMDLAAGTMPDSVLTPICEELAAGGTCLLQTSEDIQAVHEHFRSQGKSETEAGEKIARSLAAFVRDVISLVKPEGLIVAGGETASVLSRVLGFGALAVGPNIEPGVPVCVTLSGPALPVVLKSGNFGSENFYRLAIDSIRALEHQDTQAAQEAQGA